MRNSPLYLNEYFVTCIVAMSNAAGKIFTERHFPMLCHLGRRCTRLSALGESRLNATSPAMTVTSQVPPIIAAATAVDPIVAVQQRSRE
jgi:hypothetical protein